MTADELAEVEAPPPAAEPMMARVVQRLLGFWVDRGHVLLSPSDVPIPAGNMHPEVFFNLLEERPWSSVVAQPVRRPRDGRGGLHPYRLARHLELHVLLRGDVGKMQDLYMESLEAIGLEVDAHSVTFTDGPWEAHSLGAWGTGWHVQLDGLGVARLTFLRQLAGQPLERPAAELVYGVERTALVLADVAGVDALTAGPHSVAGEPWRSAEEELSRYAFEVADAGAWQSALSGREDEARRCLAAGLPRMAYELAIGNLQHIELLLARGELEIRDRLQALERVRDLVTAAAEWVRTGSETIESGAAEATDGTPSSVEVDEPAEVPQDSEPAPSSDASSEEDSPSSEAAPEGEAQETESASPADSAEDAKPPSKTESASSGKKRRTRRRKSSGRVASKSQEGKD